MIKNIFARIWALWGLLTFVATFIVIFPISMISYAMEEIKGQEFFIKVSRVWMRVWLLLIGCPVSIKGREHFAKGENYIVLFNHNSLLDVPLSAPFVPGSNKTIAKNSFARVPLFGLFYKKGAVLVDRGNEKSRSLSFEKMQQVLAAGMHMCIYPEGTRNRTKEPLKAFYDGAFRLAKTTHKKIIPCIINGTRKAMPVNKPFYLLPVKLSMEFLPPVNEEGLSVQQLKEKVHSDMTAAFLRDQRS